MSIEASARSADLAQHISAFMAAHVYPAEATHLEQLRERPWSETPVIREIRAKARTEGLWNLFLPREYAPYSPGLSNLEYAPLAELMGRSEIGSAAFNCEAPDTGNMEVLARYGTDAQKRRWLEPLLAGDIRSSFAMTEPDVASSDATNIETSIVRDGDHYVINGRKYYASNALHEDCAFLVLLGKSNPGADERHRQHSQILVPLDTPGVRVLRSLSVFGFDDAPGGHAEIVLENVRVPAENLLLGEGRGFEIAQGRLGPGRIHHCMRLIGRAQRALEMMIDRANQRVAFGRTLGEQQSVREDIALSACEIEQARLLTLKAAEQMDLHGNKVAKDLIAMIKIVAPRMACRVIDRAIQIHGAAGVSQDTILARSYAYARKIRIADGPDQVHMMQLGRTLLHRQRHRNIT
ncbi:acyl-CoA dehydrogenase family protein [Sinimarinibacterium flocculans]|uniref:acyl-CoA dehydrogenase family protein n=1 Tax=Sinimarinibacterium flocculans TaxID=985250 RepID=UPI002490140F|nr:acyl-CoA dehydrogenase family protein [Sinimarinibacterium flocculans]